MSQVTRHNHFIPQAYLRRWSRDGKHVYSYRTLVSSKNVPKWKLRPIRGVAYHRDLYTTFADGQEVDDFEKWIAREFEEPATQAIEKAVLNSSLGPSDWDRLALFFAAQDLRTPASLLESMKRWETLLPQLLDDTSRNAVSLLKEARTRGSTVALEEKPNPFTDFFNVRLDRGDGSSQGQISIRVELSAGRELWLASMRHLLTGAPARNLKRHKWSIVEPSGRAEWFTSDHPALRLNYYAQGKYDFKGGWGNPRTDLILPLSPRHILYTQVGAEYPDRFTMTEQQTLQIQRILAERAHRWIFAFRPSQRVFRFRPRHVDAAAVKAEEVAWDRWHEGNRQMETGQVRNG